MKRSALLIVGLSVLVPYIVGVVTHVRPSDLDLDVGRPKPRGSGGRRAPRVLRGHISTKIGVAGAVLVGFLALSALTLATFAWHPLQRLERKPEQPGDEADARQGRAEAAAARSPSARTPEPAAATPEKEDGRCQARVRRRRARQTGQGQRPAEEAGARRRGRRGEGTGLGGGRQGGWQGPARAAAHSIGRRRRGGARRAAGAAGGHAGRVQGGGRRGRADHRPRGHPVRCAAPAGRQDEPPGRPGRRPGPQDERALGAGRPDTRTRHGGRRSAQPQGARGAAARAARGRTVDRGRPAASRHARSRPRGPAGDRRPRQDAAPADRRRYRHRQSRSASTRSSPR